MSVDPGELIAAYNDETAYIADILDSEKRLVQAARITEAVIKDHFHTNSHEKLGLGQLLYTRKKFLGRRFANAAFAVDIRNRVSHHTSQGFPSDEEMRKASDVLLVITGMHIRELEKRIKTKSNSPELRDSDTEPENPQSSIQHDFSSIAQPSPSSTKLKRNPLPILDALESDPKITASTIAEHVFCPRAGILTHIGSNPDPENELPSLGLLPWYEQQAIEEAYAGSCLKLLGLTVGFVAGVALLSLYMSGHFLFPVILVVVMMASVYVTKLEYDVWQQLGQRRLAANLAGVCDPDPHSEAFQAVDWWGLLKAGFEVRRPEEAFFDRKWMISGKPRRVLSKGSATIPVHRINKTSGPLSPQQIVRVMAHCHLIETAEGANCPFAIILYGNTYQGTTVPNTRLNREKFYTALERVRRTITESDDRNSDPPEPIVGSICGECPHGRPRTVANDEKTMYYGEPLEPFPLAGKKETFHCDCGDRFRWKPLHNRNKKLQRLD